MRIELFIKPRYGLTIGLHLHDFWKPLLWHPRITHVGDDWSFSWLDISLTISRYGAVGR